MPESTLFSRCKVNTNIEDDTFVGIKLDSEGVSVHFPLGFNYKNDSEEDLRRDILLTIQTIGETVGQKESDVEFDQKKMENTAFPIRAYLNVIEDYYARGYYKESEIQYHTGIKGKIDWNRTIKTQSASIKDDEAYYLNMVIRKNQPKDDALITLIHMYCVYESFKKIGWLFTAFIPEKPMIEYNKSVFQHMIREKLFSTFNDRNKQLFRSMLAIVEFQGENDAPQHFIYGTYRFEYVWEKLIDKVYGIEDKQDYFPKTKWKLKGMETYDNSSLEPDSIMIFDNDIYVLDAKYYKFGWTKHAADLPQSSSINKQITYGEYVTKKREQEKGNYKIYNAFLMPFDSSDDFWKSLKKESMINIGEAISEWKDNDKDFEKVQGILIDTKHLMNMVVHNDQYEIMKLAEFISQKIITGKN